MSHFSVAVFTDENSSVETLLEPFYEGLEVEKYIALTKEDVIKRGKEMLADAHNATTKELFFYNPKHLLISY